MTTPPPDEDVVAADAVPTVDVPFVDDETVTADGDDTGADADADVLDGSSDERADRGEADDA